MFFSFGLHAWESLNLAKARVKHSWLVVFSPAGEVRYQYTLL